MWECIGIWWEVVADKLCSECDDSFMLLYNLCQNNNKISRFLNKIQVKCKL